MTLGRLAEALLILDRLVSLYADCAGAQHQRGQVLFDLGRSEEAKLCFDRALTLDPSHVEAWVDQATTLRSLGHVEQACLALDQALLLAPTHHRARFNLADCHLHLGRFATGWELYEARRLLPTALPAPDVSQPLWDGSQAVQGRRIFVWWEQAIGDSFQFVRYVRELESAGAMVYLSAPASLHAVLSTVSARCTLLDPGQMPAQYDYHCPLQSLPRAFATRVSSIPSQVPYLSAEPSRRLAWKTRLGDAGFKVGVAWSGAVRQAGHGRSFPLKELLPLSQIPGVRLISLQMNAGVEQLADCPPGLSVEVLPYPVDQEGSAFIDTAAIIDNLDLVISCDTSIAHLAGALGVPVWVALKFMPDWRWGVSGTQCAWYPSMRLFRQSLRWHWGPVFYAMNEQLRAQLAATGIR